MDGPATGGPDAGRLALFGWIMFDWAAQPVFLLVQTFFFGPFFVAHFVGNPVTGQTLWSWVVAISGMSIALLSPVFGAIADQSGRRKSWIAAFSALLIVGGLTLWMAVPGDNSRIALIMAATVLVFVGTEFATVFTNAMLPSLVPLTKVGRLSGVGWATGYAGGLLALILFLAFLLPGSETGRTMLGLTPLVALDAASHEPARLTGPIAALWYLVFVLPFFLFTADRPRHIRKVRSAAPVRDGIRELVTTLGHIRANNKTFKFLIARMLYADGLSAIFAFGAIYAASTFGWGTTQLGLFAVLLAITGLIGALVGGVADDRIGARTVIIAGLLGLLACTFTILSIDASHVGWVFAVAPSTAEWAFVAAAAGLGLTAGPIQSSSRSMMARLTPPEKASEFFGFFAFSGKATAFAAPALVGLTTWLSNSQRIGMSTIALFIIAGFWLLCTLDLPRSGDDARNVSA